MSLTQSIYETLYNLDLRTVGWLLGCALIAAHGFALVKSDSFKERLKRFPRNHRAGVVVLAVSFNWALLVWTEMDLGEFYTLERTIQGVLIVGFFLTARYVTDFLAVRATGMFLILLAAPLLDAAFLEPPASRLLVVFAAYAWAVAGMFFVGMPYLMRDAITWVTSSPQRGNAGCAASIAYGVVVASGALLFY